MKSGVVGVLFGAKKRRGMRSPMLMGLYVLAIPRRTWSFSLPGSFHRRFMIGLATLERLRIGSYELPSLRVSIPSQRSPV